MVNELSIMNPAQNPISTKTVMQIRNLGIRFAENTVLDHFNLDLHRGENIVVLGKSGSGKSVLIKCIIGLLTPDEGEILVFGKNIPDLGHHELDEIRVKMGFLFQANALYDSMTVRENLEFPLRRHSIRLSADETNALVTEALSDVGLGHTIDMLPAELSGGMRKRIALARTLILKPEIILYDEPTTGLDPITGGEITDLIMELREKYKTSSLIISHDMRCVKKTADKIAVLLGGKCYALGTYEELNASTDKLIKQFFE
jgi:phospholipid/cholesterol/gamma-HCH transport system ATP-binding protein